MIIPKMKEIVCSAIGSNALCRAYFKYETGSRFLFPLKASGKLFLCAEEDDFILNGFSVRRFFDMRDIAEERGRYSDIVKAEGISDNIIIPDIDIDDWRSTFLSLQSMDEIIIVERESREESECEFAIGKIEKVYRDKVAFRDFDSECVWSKEPLTIPFSRITSVTIGSRYSEVYSKYL